MIDLFVSNIKTCADCLVGVWRKGATMANGLHNYKKKKSKILSSHFIQMYRERLAKGCSECKNSVSSCTMNAITHHGRNTMNNQPVPVVVFKIHWKVFGGATSAPEIIYHLCSATSLPIGANPDQCFNKTWRYSFKDHLHDSIMADAKKKKHYKSFALTNLFMRQKGHD